MNPRLDLSCILKACNCVLNLRTPGQEQDRVIHHQRFLCHVPARKEYAGQITLDQLTHNYDFEKRCILAETTSRMCQNSGTPNNVRLLFIQSYQVWLAFEQCCVQEMRYFNRSLEPCTLVSQINLSSQIGKHPSNLQGLEGTPKGIYTHFRESG